MEMIEKEKSWAGRGSTIKEIGSFIYRYMNGYYMGLREIYTQK